MWYFEESRSFHIGLFDSSGLKSKILSNVKWSGVILFGRVLLYLSWQINISWC